MFALLKQVCCFPNTEQYSGSFLVLDLVAPSALVVFDAFVLALLALLALLARLADFVPYYSQKTKSSLF